VTLAPPKEQGRTKTENNLKQNNNNNLNNTIMIVVPVKEGENIERALKKFKRKYEKTGIVKELRARQAFQKPSVINRKKMMKAVYVQQLRQAEQ
jgi:small subunit ribosomal protein S21